MSDGALLWQLAHPLALVCCCPAGVLSVQGLPALASPGEGGQRLVLGWLGPLWLLTLWFTGYTLACVAQLLVKQERKRTMRMVSAAKDSSCQRFCRRGHCCGCFACCNDLHSLDGSSHCTMWQLH
jgi:hypothetical protein